MRRTQLTAVALTTVLVAGILGTPVTPAAAADFDIVVESHVVETRHGEVYLEVARPVKGSTMVKGPAVLTYSPYSILSADDRTGTGDEGFWAPWVADGYVRVFADLVGTGNSGGCWDYGGTREKESAYDIVEWIAKQKWSTGKVGMIGGSYNGTTATAAAVMRPPHLTTIVPEAAISRWYGYAYSGGIRYALNNEFIGNQGPGAVTDEGFDTPLLFDFGLAVPPPIDVQDPSWAARVQSTITPCDEITHTEHGYDDTPDYDDFWLERDYIKDAGKVKIPVLVASNWGDWNVKQEESWNLYNALKRSEKRVLYMGTRWEGHGAPSAEHYAKTVRKWFDHYLMGVDNGVEEMPTIVSQTSDISGPGRYFEGKPKVRNVKLILQQSPELQPGDYGWKMLPNKPDLRALSFGGELTDAGFPSANINTESHASHHARNNHDWFWFESPILAKDVRIFGQPKLQIRSHVDRRWVTITPSLVEIDPTYHVTIPAAGHACVPDGPDSAVSCVSQLVAITRGWLDSRYREGLDKQVEITPGKPFTSTVPLKPLDYTLSKGNYVGLNVQTEILEWSLPKLYPGGCDNPAGTAGADNTCAHFWIDWEESQTRLVLPVVNAPRDPHRLFAGIGHQH